MALNTFGTTAATSLGGIADNNVTQANIALLQAAIKDDFTGLAVPGAFEFSGGNGLLYIPRRGVLKTFPGDWIGVDAATGWPILVSALAITSGPWQHS